MQFLLEIRYSQSFRYFYDLKDLSIKIIFDSLIKVDKVNRF